MLSGLVSVCSVSVRFQVFARFRITGNTGHTHFGLAPDGEVEDYLVTLVASKPAARSSQTPDTGASLESSPLWPSALLPALGKISPTEPSQTPAGSSSGAAEIEIVDRAINELMPAVPQPDRSSKGLAASPERISDAVSVEGVDELLQDDDLDEWL